jgi:hypothetical protein
MSSRALRRLASWIALLALLAVTFLPTIARVTSLGGYGADICSADLSRKSSPGDGKHALEHCPYCALHAELAAPPAPAGIAARAAASFRPLPAAFLQAPRTTGVWSTSQARAPPANA